MNTLLFRLTLPCTLSAMVDYRAMVLVLYFVFLAGSMGAMFRLCARVESRLLDLAGWNGFSRTNRSGRPVRAS